MEGLIPFLIDAIKKHQTHHHHHHHHHGYKRSFSHSESSNNRSYHMLMGSGSFTGSSHRRTRSESHPPTTAEALEQSYGVDGFLVSPRDPVTAAAAAPPPYAAKTTASASYAAQASSNFNNIHK